MKLVMVRHGQSLWNLENRFTGWTDIDLSDQGREEAHAAGRMLKEKGYKFDMAFSSVLQRANHTLDILLEELGQTGIPVKYNWRLNERHYGALQGLNKAETAEKYGKEQVHIWRRSADVRPPELDKSDARYPGNDPKYKDLTDAQLPLSEHLLDTVDRCVEYWNSDIKPALVEGKTCLIAAHGNSIRALVKYIENVSTADIMNIEFPTGRPIVIELDDNLNFVRRYYADQED